MTLKQSPCLNNIVKTAATVFPYAILIVHGLWSVYGQPDKYRVLFEELRPIVIKQRSIGLHGVLNDLRRAGVLFDEFNDLTIKTETHERGLAALPGNRNGTIWLTREQLLEVRLKSFCRHTHSVAGIESVFRQKEAVCAIKVADGASRFGEEMECSLGQP